MMESFITRSRAAAAIAAGGAQRLDPRRVGDIEPADREAPQRGQVRADRAPDRDRVPRSNVRAASADDQEANVRWIPFDHLESVTCTSRRRELDRFPTPAHANTPSDL